MDERVWTDAPLGADETLSIGETKISLLSPPVQACLVTGNLAQALKALAPKAPMIGLCEAAPEGAYAIRIARDNALLVLTTPLARDMGWQPEGVALSDASDVYAALHFIGGTPEALLAQGTSAPLEQGSPSAAIRFAGTPALLTRQGDGFSLRVQAASLTYISSFLRSMAV